MKNMKTAFRIVGYVFKYVPFYVISSIVVLIIQSVTLWLDFAIIEQLVKMIEVNQATFTETLKFILTIGLVNEILKLIAFILKRYVRHRCRHVWMKKIQYQMFSKVKEIDIKYYDDPNLYNKFSRAFHQDVTSINSFDSIVDVGIVISEVIVLVVYIATTVPIMFVISLVTSIISFIINSIMTKKRHKLYKESQIDIREYEYVGRTFYLEKYALDLKTTAVSDLLIDKYEQAFNRLEKKNRKTERSIYFLSIGEDFIYTFVNAFVLYVYLMYQIFFKGMLFAQFTVLSTAITRFNNRFFSLSNSIARANRDLLKLDDLLWLLDLNTKKTENLENAQFKETIELKNLEFKYPNEEKFALSDINIKINKGEKIAIIGNNGAGKTTLTKLMLKLYTPNQGQVLLDNQDYLNFDNQSVTNLYVTVLQIFQIYCATIAENIIMKKVETEDELNLINEAIKKVGVKEIIDNLPNGINTILTQEFNRNGLELSGGQKQKLAIARVFASSAPIAILDEPTSSLDPMAEKEINDNIMNLCEEQGKTLIIISHRLSTIVNVDCIYMMKDGKILEKGTHQELINKKGPYYEMFEAQAKLYKESQK